MPEEIKPVNVEALKALVRTVPDFPKPGILLRHHHSAQGQNRICATD